MNNFDPTILFYIGGFLFFIWLISQEHNMKKCRESRVDVMNRYYFAFQQRKANNIVLRRYFKAVNYE